jgi:hypothetical protein
MGNMVLSKVLSIRSMTLFNKACIALSTFSPVFALVSKYRQLKSNNIIFIEEIMKGLNGSSGVVQVRMPPCVFYVSPTEKAK